MIQMVW